MAYRKNIFWLARISMIAGALVIAGWSLLGVMRGQNLQRLEERISAHIERSESREDRIRNLETTIGERLARLEERVAQNSADIQQSSNLSIASLAGIVAFLLKEFLRLIQERKR